MNRFVTTLLVALGVAGVGVVGGSLQKPSTGSADLVELVLCAEAGAPQVVWVDAEGRTVDPDDACGEVHCPACTTSPDEVLLAAIPSAAPLRVARTLSVTVISGQHGPMRWRAPLSHGPPLARVS